VTSGEEALGGTKTCLMVYGERSGKPVPNAFTPAYVEKRGGAFREWRGVQGRKDRRVNKLAFEQ